MHCTCMAYLTRRGLSVEIPLPVRYTLYLQSLSYREGQAEWARLRQLSNDIAQQSTELSMRETAVNAVQCTPSPPEIT